MHPTINMTHQLGERGAMLSPASRTCDPALARLDKRRPRSGSPEHLSLASSSRSLGTLCLAMLLMGCVSTRVEYFVDPPYPAQESGSPIEWLSTEPEQPHIELARITAGSANVGEDTLRKKILERARSLGADAVVAEGTADVASLVNPPFYERSLFGPMGAGFGLYGYGWYTPYASNPFLLTQGAADIPRVDRYLSGLAIKYRPAQGTDGPP